MSACVCFVPSTTRNAYFLLLPPPWAILCDICVAGADTALVCLCLCNAVLFSGAVIGLVRYAQRRGSRARKASKPIPRRLWFVTDRLTDSPADLTDLLITSIMHIVRCK